MYLNEPGDSEAFQTFGRGFCGGQFSSSRGTYSVFWVSTSLLRCGSLNAVPVARRLGDRILQFCAKAVSVTEPSELNPIFSELKSAVICVRAESRPDFCRWIKRLEGTSEYQVGVELLANGADAWGIDLNKVNTAEEPEPELVMV